jgi:hypothetical protein
LSVNSVYESEDPWVEVRLPSGRSVMLRSAASQASASDDAGVIEDVRFRAFDFTTLTGTLHEIGDLISNAVRPLAPREVEVELGLSLDASTGAVFLSFGKASAEASVKVNLRWDFASKKEEEKEEEKKENADEA